MKQKKEFKSENAISVKNVSKTFSIPHDKSSTLKGAFVNIFKKHTSEEFNVLDNVSFEVKKGEFFGILGRNGSGKSTLLKILAGVYVADRGKVEVNGLISPFLELGIGFNPDLSGRDNVYLNATVLGLTEKEIDAKFDSIVSFSELERFMDQKIKNYSSGMQVRLAFSVAIHANREILLMDEVLAVGDANFQSKCLEEFSRYKEMGKTVILVTHDIGTVQRYCDRAMLIRNGKIEMIGNSEEVGNKYIFQNMSDEEKRIIKEQDQEMERIEKERIQTEKQREVEEKEAEKLKGIQKEEEIKRIEDEKIRQEEEIIKQDEERKKQEEERKNKIAEITKVEFLDKDRKEKNVFETGDNMSIRVYFNINIIKEYFSFGVGIYNKENIYITGIHSIFEKIDYKKYLEKGFFQIDFKEIELKEGTYYIKASIAGKSVPPFYDYLDKSDLFKIISIDLNKEGLVKLKYNWN